LVDDVPSVLEAVRSQLKPGGLFLSKTVCIKEADWPTRLLIPTLTALRLAPRVTPLSRAELVQHITDAGLTVEVTTHFGSNRISPFIAARNAA
jgi:cyclopropane fatty-acyl-phospholipid synthase-like methyltransferase